MKIHEMGEEKSYGECKNVFFREEEVFECCIPELKRTYVFRNCCKNTWWGIATHYYSGSVLYILYFPLFASPLGLVDLGLLNQIVRTREFRRTFHLNLGNLGRVDGDYRGRGAHDPLDGLAQILSQLTKSLLGRTFASLGAGRLISSVHPFLSTQILSS